MPIALLVVSWSLTIAAGVPPPVAGDADRATVARPGAGSLGPGSSEVESAPTLTSDAQCDPAASRTVRVMLMGLEGASDEKQRRAFDQVVAEEAQRVEGFQVLTPRELQSILDREAQAQLAGCDDSSCLAEIAAALDAELLVAGQVSTQDGAAVVSLSLLNTRALVTVNRVTLSWPGEPSLFPEVVRAAAQRLVLEGRARKPGRIRLESIPPEALVSIDGEPVELDEDGITPPIDVGPVELRVEADGYDPLVLVVLVRGDRTLVVDGQLESQPIYTSWWLWAGVATAAVLGVAGGAVAVIAATGSARVSATADATIPSATRPGAAGAGGP